MLSNHAAPRPGTFDTHVEALHVQAAQMPPPNLLSKASQLLNASKELQTSLIKVTNLVTQYIAQAEA